MSLTLGEHRTAVAIAGTSAPLSATTLKRQSVIITADPTNAGPIWIGSSNVSASSSIGTPLDPGENLELTGTDYFGTDEFIDLNLVYVDAENDGDAALVSYFVRVKDGAEVSFSNNKSLSFDGVEEYVNLGNDSSLDITAAITVCFWVKGANLGDGVGSIIASKWNPTGNNRTWLTGHSNTSGQDGKLRVLIEENGLSGTSNRKWYDTATDVFDGTWHHAAFTFTSDTLKIYVDGTEDTPTIRDNATVNSLYSSSENTLIGTFGSFSQYHNGNIDELAIYNAALSSAQISEIYNGGNPNNLAALSSQGNLVSWWRNGDAVGDTGSSIQDQVGSNDGTTVNMDDSNIVEDAP